MEKRPLCNRGLDTLRSYMIQKNAAVDRILILVRLLEQNIITQSDANVKLRHIAHAHFCFVLEIARPLNNVIFIRIMCSNRLTMEANNCLLYLFAQFLRAMQLSVSLQ